MNDLIDTFVPSQEQIQRLESLMREMPQVVPVTEHYFSEGMYCRKMWRPAGTLIVGKVHKKAHLFMCVAGEIIAWTENGMRTLRAGDVVQSQPGTKRVTLAVVDSVGLTVHRTDKTDLNEIEAELIEDDPLALFDANNQLKNGKLAHTPVSALENAK